MTTRKPDPDTPIIDSTSGPHGSDAPPEAPILEPALDAATPRALGRRGLLGFLAGASVTAPLAGGLGWMARSRHAADAPDPALLPTWSPRPSKASLGERPRLVFAIPTEQHGPLDAYTLGHAFGEYLNHGSDEQLAPLALVYPEFADGQELGNPEPFSILLITRERARTFRFELPVIDGDAYRHEENTQRIIDRRIAGLADAIREAIAPEGWPDHFPQDAVSWSPRMAAIAAWAAAGKHVARADDDSAGAMRVRDLPAGAPAPITPGEVSRYASGLYAIALRTTGPARADLFAMLAEHVRARFVRGAIPGAEWARSGGCGAEIEGRDGGLGVLCGMGFVPERSQRFLHFYTAGY